MLRTAKTVPAPVQFDDRSFNLGISHEIAILMLEAQESLYGHTAIVSQNRIWIHVRMIARYLNSTGEGYQTRLPNNILPGIYEWLAPQSYSRNYMQAAWSTIKNLIRWCDRNYPQMFTGQVIYDQRFFASEPAKPLSALSSEISKKIMTCALAEISEISERIGNGREELAARVTPRSLLIAELLDSNNGWFPTQEAIIMRSNNLIRRVLDAGGVRKLVRTIYPTRRDLLPFFIAIQFQLAGNPLAVKNMRRDCIRPNYLREDREVVNWDKPRSKRTQQADFSAQKASAAPSLIRTLLRLNDTLVEFPGADKTKLFICYNSGRVGIPSEGSWLAALADFQERHSLPDFKFVQLRKTAAVLHHKAGGSILHAKNKLNHRSVSATVRYTDLNDRSEQHDQIIAENQSALSCAVTPNLPSTERSPIRKKIAIAPVDTVFGFLCTDPMTGFGTTKNTDGPCDHFNRCAGCPGALVPLDRIDVVAALLRSRDALIDTNQRAQQENWLDRFDSLYKPTLDVIETKLLPAVSKQVLDAANDLATQRPFPKLE